eukprot:3065070-Amphidinium_carterae.1
MAMQSAVTNIVKYTNYKANMSTNILSHVKANLNQISNGSNGRQATEFHGSQIDTTAKMPSKGSHK